MTPQSKDRSKTTPAVLCIKILLHMFNFFYMVIGGCVLGIGVWTQLELKAYMKLTDMYYDNAAYVMIGVGALIVLCAFGGFVCTAKDKVALLYIYAVFISILAVLQIAAGIAGGVYSQKIDHQLSEGLHKSINNTIIGQDPESKKAWDKIQSTFECCGVESYKDWGIHIPDSCNVPGSSTSGTQPPPSTASTQKSASSTSQSPTIPTSMPIVTSTASTTSTTPTTASSKASTSSSAATATSSTTAASNSTSSTQAIPTQRRKRQATEYYADGCLSKLSATMKKYLAVIVGTCVGFVALQIFGAIMACCLAKKTTKNNYEQIY